MLFKKNNDAAQTEAASNKNTSAPDNHRDAVSPSERAMIAAASGDTHKSGAAPAKPASTKYDYLNAPIVKSRPCPLCGEHLEADTVFCPKCNNRVVSIYDEALILRRQGKTLPKKETKTEPAAPAKTEVPKAEAKPAPAAPKAETPKAEIKPAPAAPKAEAPKAEIKPAPAAPKKAEAPKAEVKPAPAAPKKAEAPKVEVKPAPVAPKKAEAPKAEVKPAHAAPKKAEAPKTEAKPAPAAPKKAEAPKAEAKPATKKGGLAAFTDPDTPDSLVIKVTGSGYTKHTMNPHFSPADDFDDFYDGECFCGEI